MPKNLQPREKASIYGLETLTDIELMALFIRTGADQNVLSVCTELLSKFSSIAVMQNATREELQKINGIGPIKSLEIKALFEFAKRLSFTSNISETKPTIKELVSKSLSLIKNFNKEYFIIVLLNAKGHFLHLKVLNEGTNSEVLIDPKEIVTTVLKNDGVGLFCFHNHPSGDIHPSHADILMTKRIKNYCNLFGIDFKGHYVINKNKKYLPIGIKN